MCVCVYVCVCVWGGGGGGGVLIHYAIHNEQQNWGDNSLMLLARIICSSFPIIGLGSICSFFHGSRFIGFLHLHPQVHHHSRCQSLFASDMFVFWLHIILVLLCHCRLVHRIDENYKLVIVEVRLVSSRTRFLPAMALYCTIIIGYCTVQLKK